MSVNVDENTNENKCVQSCCGMWLNVQQTNIFPQKIQEEDKPKDIGSSWEALSRYSPGSASPHKHKRISQSHLNPLRNYNFTVFTGISVVLATWQTI